MANMPCKRVQVLYTRCSAKQENKNVNTRDCYLIDPDKVSYGHGVMINSNYNPLENKEIYEWIPEIQK